MFGARITRYYFRTFYKRRVAQREAFFFGENPRFVIPNYIHRFGVDSGRNFEYYKRKENLQSWGTLIMSNEVF